MLLKCDFYSRVSLKKRDFNVTFLFGKSLNLFFQTKCSNILFISITFMRFSKFYFVLKKVNFLGEKNMLIEEMKFVKKP